MKIFALFSAVLAAATLAGTVWAGEDKKEQPLCLELNLIDDSRVIGTPGIESVSVQTSYAKMDIPLKQILTIKMGEDHETASIDLQNSDKLKGVINLGPIKLQTVFGKVAIGIEHIRDIRVILTGGALQDALRHGLVLYYSFDRDENGKVRDESGKRNDGKVHDAKWTANGKRGGAFLFSGGSQRIEAADCQSFSLKPDEDKTFSLWWKKRGEIHHKLLIAKHEGGDDGHGFLMLTLPNEKCYYLPSMRHWDKYSANLLPDEWNHLVLIKQGTTWKTYQNGAECPHQGSAGQSLNNVDFSSHAPLSIGGWAIQPENSFNGFIDEIMIYNRALSEKEIKQIYDTQK